MAIKWLKQTSDGWIITLDSAGKRRSLPSHLELDVSGTTDGRDQFTVKEGVHSGATGSIKTASGLLLDDDQHLPGATVVFEDREGGGQTNGFDNKSITISLPASDGVGPPQTLGPFKAVGDPDNPIPDGDHVLEIPDFPHDAAAGMADYSTVWFRIGSSGDRYLHPGTISAGCATCDKANWPAIYKALIQARDGSGNVGTITVK